MSLLQEEEKEPLSGDRGQRLPGGFESKAAQRQAWKECETGAATQANIKSTKAHRGPQTKLTKIQHQRFHFFSGR